MERSRKDHWENVYTQKSPAEVSWYQSNSEISLDLIASTGIEPRNQVIDIGGGAAILVDKLLDKGYGHVTVLDISSKSIEYAQKRLGDYSKKVT